MTCEPLENYDGPLLASKVDVMKTKPAYLPLYQQVKASLIKRIAAGEWPPGTFLPSETALAEEYGVSQGTLRKALVELTNAQSLVRYQGKGTAVAAFDSDQDLFRFLLIVDSQGRKVLPMSQMTLCETGVADDREAGALNLAPGARVYRLERIRFLEGTPVIIENITLPLERFPGLEEVSYGNLPNTLYDYFQKQFSVIIASASEQLSAVSATSSDVRKLHVPMGSPLLQILRVARTLDGEPVELRLSRLNTVNHHYQSEVR